MLPPHLPASRRVESAAPVRYGRAEKAAGVAKIGGERIALRQPLRMAAKPQLRISKADRAKADNAQR
jgi:hypothetical protein